MDGSSEAKPAGKWIRTLEGYEAFHPFPLAPEIEWTQDVVTSLANASTLIGNLAGEGKRLPNPHLLMRPFICREAVYSSRIEGTQSTLGELLASEAGAAVERSPEDLREVGNYVAALEYGLKRLKTLPLSLRLVRELHEKLKQGVRGQYAAPGEFRRSQNWIGAPGAALSQASFVPPPVDALEEHLSLWEKFLHDRMLPPLVHTALAHYQFEAIHPFLDGNGRVGRLMITLELCEREILPGPLLYLSAFFEATREEYYNCLRAVSENGEWNRWLQYFLNGVARQSEDALSRAGKINELLEQWSKNVAGKAGGKSALEILQMLAANPFIKVGTAKERLGVTFNTAARAIGLLEENGIVREVSGAKRGRVFCAEKILEVLEGPARVKF